MHLLLPKDCQLSFLEVFYRNAKFCRWAMFQTLLEFDFFFFGLSNIMFVLTGMKKIPQVLNISHLR